MREIDHPHDAEDDAQAYAHQAIGAADHQARGQRLQEIDSKCFHRGALLWFGSGLF